MVSLEPPIRSYLGYSGLPAAGSDGPVSLSEPLRAASCACLALPMTRPGAGAAELLGRMLAAAERSGSGSFVALLPPADPRQSWMPQYPAVFRLLQGYTECEVPTTYTL